MTSPATPASTPPRRDLRLDALRGFAVLTIALNHFGFLVERMGRQGPDVPTLTKLGYSSAAELFFLLSGFLIGRLYLSPSPRDRLLYATKRVMSRGLMLYMYNAMLFLLLACVATLAPPLLQEATKFEQFVQAPMQTLAAFATLRWQPLFLDVLQAYSLLLWTAPVLIVVLLWSRIAFLTLVVALYLVQQLAPPGPPGSNAIGGAFNLLAWQLLFYGGMWLGGTQALERFTGWIERHRAAVAWLVAALALTLVVGALDRYGARVGLDFDLPGADKRNLGPVRLAHSVLVVLTLLALATRGAHLLDTPVLKPLARIGQCSLEAFAFSLVLNYGAAAWWLRQPSDLTYFAAAAGTVGLLAAQASFLSHWRRWDKHKPSSLGPTLTAAGG